MRENIRKGVNEHTFIQKNVNNHWHNHEENDSHTRRLPHLKICYLTCCFHDQTQKCQNARGRRHSKTPDRVRPNLLRNPATGGTLSEEQKAWGALLSLPSSQRVTVTQIANFYYFCCFLLLQKREISKQVHSGYTTLSQSCLPMLAFSAVVPLLFSFFVVPSPLVVAARLLTSHHFATLYNLQAQVVLVPIVCKQKNFQKYPP